VRTLARQRRYGTFQRFINYLERDFIARLGELREAHERAGVRVVAAGPNAFVYFMHDAGPLPVEQIDERHPGLVDELSRHRGVGFLLARSADGPVCIWRGKRYGATELAQGPFARREDVDLIAEGIRDLMAMRCAGDLVLYGEGAVDGDVSYIGEHGAHAGPGWDEMQTFVIHPAAVTMPSFIRHPLELYEHFIAYRTSECREAA
jgi:hypothetical protein